MTKFTFLTIIFFLAAYSTFIHGKSPTKNDSVKIQIFSNEVSNDIILLKIAYYNLVDSVFIDSSGFGSITLPINHPTFAYLTNIDHSEPIKLILDGGFDIKITKENDSISFAGIGCEENKFLQKLYKFEYVLDKKYADFKKLKDGELENSEDIILSYQLLDSMLNTYAMRHKINSGNELINNLIIGESLVFAKSLIFRDLYFHCLNKGEIITASQIEELDLNAILNSDESFKVSSQNIGDFLLYYNENLLLSILNENDIEPKAVHLLNLKNLAENKKLGNLVKERLMYWNIHFHINYNGISDPTYEAISFFENHFEISSYSEKIKKLVNQYHPLSRGQEAINFSFENTLGDELSLADFEGKYIFIGVWASWCGPCVENMPKIEGVVDSFPDIQFIFLNKESKNKWLNSIKDKDKELLKNHFVLTNSDFDSNYKISFIPRYIFIDKSGKIIDAFYKFENTEDLKAFFERELD
jgi:thiol-disulfide isomerase/thioredoxin